MLAHMKSVLFLAVATGAGLVSVNALTLSDSCQASLKGLLTNPDAACMNPTALFSFAVGQNQGSIPGAVDTWLSGICSQGSCTDESISNVINNVTTGCNDDLASFGVSLQDISGDIVSVAQQVYPTVRQVACLKDDSANQLCATEMLNNLESIIGGLSLDDLSFLNILSDVQQLISSGVQNLACTNCIKAGFSIAQENFPSIVSAAVPEAQALCGADFTDGSSADSITETANSEVFAAQSASGNGAFTLRGFGKTGMALGVFAVFALLL